MRRFSRFLAFVVVLLPVAAARAESINHDRRDPCLVAAIEEAVPLANRERPKISRQAASYVVRHVHSACQIIVSATGQGAVLEPVSASLRSILSDIYRRVLIPIFRSHSDLMTASIAEPLNNGQAATSPNQAPSKVYRATKKDISRSEAIQLIRDLMRAELSMIKVSSDFAAKAADKKFEGDVDKAIVNAVAELSLATKVVGDAYPDVWTSQIIAVVPRPGRTAESDEKFRQSAMPHGSVSLTPSAVAMVKSFMGQARRENPKGDEIACIQWVTDQRSRGPEDADWTNLGVGLALGAYARSQVPPDIIDKVDGIEIIFTADNPSRLAGKTIDFKKGRFVVHD